METVAMAYDVYEPSEQSEKSPILLIHGLFWNKHMFKDLASSLCWETGRKVFCLDMRCHDQSPFSEKFNVELVAEDIKRFIRDRNLEKIVFVCHSLSCSAAYLVALDEPEKVEKIVMIDHAPFSDYTDEFYKVNVIPQFNAQNRFLDTLDKSLSLMAAKRKILSLCKTAGVTAAQKLFLQKVAYDLTKENGQFKFKTNHKFLIEGYLENCRPRPRGRSDHEILIIRCNASPRVTDEKFEAVVRHNPNAKLVTMNDVTHMLMFEKQEEFLSIVKDFLSRSGPMETVELAYDVYETSDTQLDRCPIIFLHGLFWNKYMLRDLADSICHLTKRKVFCLDLRCHDRSPFREQCHADVMAEDIKRFIEDRKLKKVAFVCHSFSCTVAYLVLVDKPDLVEKIVMVDHPPYPDYTDTSFNEDVYPQFVIQNRFLETLDPSLSLSAAKRKITNLSNSATTEGQRIFLQKVAYELKKVNNQFKWKTDHKFLIDGYQVNCRPTPRGYSKHEILIIRSKGSTRVTDEKFEKVLKYNPNARLMTIDDTTHLLMFEKPEEFLEAVRDFLS